MTTVSRGDKVVRFGPGLPTALIGERINPTGRKRFGEALRSGDLSIVQAEAERQAQAGADLLDVNVGAGGIDEPATLVAAVELVMASVDVPVVIDSSDPDALVAALRVYDGKALVNSVTAEEASMKAILPVVAEHQAAVIALPHDEHGIPTDPRERLGHAARIIEEAARLGIPAEDVVVDCLAMPVGAEAEAATRALDTLRLIRDELGIATTAGVSNISFGLPDRKILNEAFLTMALREGLSAPIADPLAPGLRRLCRGADVLLAHDPRCRRYVADYRSHPDG